MKPQLMIISQHQFGYLTDSFKWCEYLNKTYDITYICYDMKEEKLSMPNVRIKYFDIKGNRYTRGIRFLIMCILNILFFKGKVIIVYFEKCEIIKMLLPFKKINLDIRTFSVSKDAEYRKKYDSRIINASKYFNHISIISQGLANKLINIKKPISILPLGSDVISNCSKTYDALNLLYVGTLDSRNIEQTLYGLSDFIKNNPVQIPISYDIIGDGNNNELENLKRISNELNLNSIITFHGRLPYNKLKPFFDKCNIGVSYVPITDYFEFQPPTKTYEYILSGLFTIGTATTMQKDIINTHNGVLIQDTPKDFANALIYLTEKLSIIKEKDIRDSLKNHKWEHIINDSLIPILKII